MSLSLIMMDKDRILIGADTAISTIINNEIIRVSNNGKKILN